jgi:stearoyl-CoA desaturase (delta-9 desaturase)
MKIFEASAKSVFISKELLQLIGLAAIVYFVYMQMYTYLLIGLIFRMLIEYIPHHVGLHRYFTHRSFKTSKFWHILLCLTCPLTGMGSPIGYAMAHNAHHKYSDKELDPHSPKFTGFFNSIMVRWNYEGVSFNMPRNLRDPWVFFVHRWYLLIIITFCALLLIIDPLLFLSYCVAMVLGKINLISNNYVCHLPNVKINYRNFDTPDNSQNNLINGWFVGEWHNNHHARPGEWNQRVKWWEWDVPSVVIKLIKK